MFYIYILLIIIAIGVLLMSKEGKALLSAIPKLFLVGGLIYIGFLIVIYVIGLLSDTNIRDEVLIYGVFILFIVGGIILLWNFNPKKNEDKDKLSPDKNISNSNLNDGQK